MKAPGDPTLEPVKWFLWFQAFAFSNSTCTDRYAEVFAAQRAKAEAEGGDDAGAGGGEADASASGGDKRKRAGGDGAAPAKKAAEERPPFALKPDNEALLKKIVTIAKFVAKNGGAVQVECSLPILVA